MTSPRLGEGEDFRLGEGWILEILVGILQVFFMKYKLFQYLIKQIDFCPFAVFVIL